jgi:EpsI family protein
MTETPARPPTALLSARSLALFVLLLAASMLAQWLRPQIASVAAAPRLNSFVPRTVGKWRELPTPRVLVDVSEGPNVTTRDRPYDDQMARTYTDGQGHFMMVALAYGARQRQEIKIHRPELCYPAQGWKVQPMGQVQFGIESLHGMPVIGHQMLARNDVENEAVSYWIRIGQNYSDSAWKTRWTIIKEGLQGRMTDGMLVRFSESVPFGQSPEAAFERQRAFAHDLIQSLPVTHRWMLIN